MITKKQRRLTPPVPVVTPFISPGPQLISLSLRVLTLVLKGSLLNGLVVHIKGSVPVLKDLVRHLFVLLSLKKNYTK